MSKTVLELVQVLEEIVHELKSDGLKNSVQVNVTSELEDFVSLEIIKTGLASWTINLASGDKPIDRGRLGPDYKFVRINKSINLNASFNVVE